MGSGKRESGKEGKTRALLGMTAAGAILVAVQAALPVPAFATGSAQHAPARSWSQREGLRYKRNWGVDIEGVKVVSSGYMLAFRYRVVNADKAKALSEKTSSPYLIDEATGIRMAVPNMEQVGDLRQAVTPEVGRSYFIIFGNPGKIVKPGSKVSVVIGNFHVENLAAQ